MPSISVRRLYQDNQRKLQMSWTAGTAGSKRSPHNVGCVAQPRTRPPTAKAT